MKFIMEILKTTTPSRTEMVVKLTHTNTQLLMQKLKGSSNHKQIKIINFFT